jgi:hypothetical protein
MGDAYESVVTGGLKLKGKRLYAVGEKKHKKHKKKHKKEKKEWCV